MEAQPTPQMLTVPKDAVGRLLHERVIKDKLQELNPDIFFDVGARLGMDHPNIDMRQGVYYDGFPEGSKHICSMDRGAPLGGFVCEVPVWSMIWDMVEVTWDEVSDHELVTQEPPYPMPCFHDPNKIQIKRQVRGDVILSGWRHTFEKLMRKGIPNINRGTLEAAFQIDFRDVVECCEIPEEGEAPWESPSDAPDEGEVLEEMGLYEARPTVVLTDGDK